MINWAITTLMLRQHYGSTRQVMLATGVSDRHIDHLCRGEVAEPRFDAGLRILDAAYDVLTPEQFARVRKVAA